MALLLLAAGSGRCQAPPVSAAAQLEHAAGLIKAGDWREAEQTLRALLRVHPNQPDALNLLGIAAGKQGRAPEAEALFRKALAANPALAPAWVNLSEVYRQGGDGMHALETLEEGLRRVPHDAYLLSKAAALLADGGRFAEAIQRLERVPPAERDSDYWQLMGSLHLSAGDLPLAEEDLRRALEGRPASVAPLRQLAGIALKRGDPAHAWQYMVLAMKVAPNSPELLYEYAQICQQNHLASEAVLAMRKAALMEPDRPEFLFFLGTALLDTPDFHEALPRFRRYIELRPDDPRGHLSLGWSLFLEKDLPGARRELEETLRLDPKQADAWYHLGMIAYETNDDAQAQQLLTHALDLAPEHPRAPWGLGLVYARQGQHDKARDAFELAARRDPEDPKVHYQLSQVYTRLRDTANARRELQLYREAQQKSEERIKLSQQLPSMAQGGRRP
jgi:Flp pilus assembly protein TadD